MKRLALYALILGIITSMILPVGVMAAAKNPCNPCDGKKNPCNSCNPCGMMKMFHINDDRNVFTFESKAPLEKIVGTTSKITGHVHLDAKDITKGFMATFDLDVASMKTGIDLRDQHMRENFLETGKYPKATLTVDKLTKVSAKQLMDQKPITVDAEGTLNLHGMKKKVELKGIQVAFFKESEAIKAKMPGDLLTIVGSFSLKLPDYNIKVPQMIVLKLDENIKVNVDLVATTTMMSGNPCNPCGGKNPCNPCGGKK